MLYNYISVNYMNSRTVKVSLNVKRVALLKIYDSIVPGTSVIATLYIIHFPIFHVYYTIEHAGSFINTN